MGAVLSCGRPEADAGQPVAQGVSKQLSCKQGLTADGIPDAAISAAVHVQACEPHGSSGSSTPVVAALALPADTAAGPPAGGGKQQQQPVDSASSAAFLTWAREQSSRRSMALDDFVVSCCTDGAGGPDSVAARLASAAAASSFTSSCDGASLASSAGAVQPFAPHDGWLRGPPKPSCHEARIAAADGINALRRTRDGELEGMLRLLCKVFEVETATVALLTGEAIFISGACGALPVCVCPDRWGFCGWSFLNAHHELLVVEDMDADARFADNFFVTDPGFRLKFYVAAPLITANGHRLGTMCVMGQSPRKFDALKGQLLANLAELLVRQLEGRWAESLRDAGSPERLLRDASCYASPVLVLDLSASPWRVLHMNEAARDATGVDWGASYADLPCFADGRGSATPWQGLALDALFSLDAARLAWGAPGAWEFSLSGLAPAPGAPAALSAAAPRYRLCCRLALCDGLDESQPFFVGVPSWLALSPDNAWGRNYFFAELAADEAPALAAAAPFAGDSAEQLALLTDRLFKPDACAGSSSSSSSSSAAGSGSCSPAWLPRGMTLSSGASCGSPSHAAAAAGAGGAGLVGPAVAGLPVPGLVLGPLLGRGSYGRVYRGLLRGQPVAVKLIDDVASLRLTPEGEPLEAVLTRDVKHLGVMATLGYAFSDASQVPAAMTGGAKAGGRRGGGGWRPAGRVCWMVFEYCNRGVLADGVVRGWFRTSSSPLAGAPQLRTIALTALEVAAAMDHLHGQGVMHGDLCGGNVMLTACASNQHGFAAKVGDFGLARANRAAGHPADKLDDNAYGTITHQPPEVLLGGGSAFTPAADVYAWGVLLWEMLTGTRAWAGMAAPAVVCQVAVLQRRLAIPDHLPPLLAGLLAAALDPAPAARPSFASIVEQLTAFVQQSRGVDWEGWQAAADAGHAARVAALLAVDEEGAKVAATSCPMVAARAAAAAAPAAPAAVVA